jgi:hypothetical protein
MAPKNNNEDTVIALIASEGLKAFLKIIIIIIIKIIIILWLLFSTEMKLTVLCYV